MKILYVAVFVPGSSSNVWQADAFETIGHKVIRYDYRTRPIAITTTKQRDDELIELCRSTNPDIMIFSKCNGMHYRVLKECQKICKTIMWYMDDMNHVDIELTEKFTYSNFIFCSTKRVTTIAKEFCDNSFRHPCEGGFNPKIHYPIDLPKTRDVLFLGWVDGYITPYREQLKKQVNFESLYGIFGKEQSKIVSQTKINLNLTRGDGVSNRLYKLLAMKAFVLTMPWDTMKEDFVPNKNFVIFNNAKELKKKINYYLKNEIERNKIAKSGYKSVQKYSNINYAEFILEKIK